MKREIEVLILIVIGTFTLWIINDLKFYRVATILMSAIFLALFYKKLKKI